jgi:KDO2-lipid IV(A) lauroyltransferase
MKVLYYLFYAFAWLFSLIPFRILYLLSDILYVFVYRIGRYRRAVIRRNLLNAYPKESKREIRRIERKFYRYLCDYFVESLKTMNMSDKQFKKRAVFKNPEILYPYLDQGKSIFVYLSHYGNWEWLSFSIVAHTKKRNFNLYPVYNTQKNKLFNDIFLRLRSSERIIPVAQREMLRKVIKTQKENKAVLYVFIADQSPAPENIYYWTTFLNQPTAPIVGPERIAKLTDCPVVFADVSRVKRGHYAVEFIVMAENAKITKQFELTEKYMRLLEKRILKAPYYWLWTHRRWKYMPNDPKVLKYVELQEKEMVFNLKNDE